PRHGSDLLGGRGRADSEELYQRSGRPYHLSDEPGGGYGPDLRKARPPSPVDRQGHPEDPQSRVEAGYRLPRVDEGRRPDQDPAQRPPPVGQEGYFPWVRDPRGPDGREGRRIARTGAGR